MIDCPHEILVENSENMYLKLLVTTMEILDLGKARIIETLLTQRGKLSDYDVRRLSAIFGIANDTIIIRLPRNLLLLLV